MNKTDLIKQLAERFDGDKKTAQVAVEGFIDLVQREVQKGRNVSISGLVSSRSGPGRPVRRVIRVPARR